MRVLTQLNRGERTALIFCVALFFAILFLSIANRTTLIHIAKTLIDPNNQQLHYVGAIVIPDQASGLCRFVQYDNKSGETRSTELAECPGKLGVDSPSNRMNTQSTFDASNRVNTVRDNFYKK